MRSGKPSGHSIRKGLVIIALLIVPLLLVTCRKVEVDYVPVNHESNQPPSTIVTGKEPFGENLPISILSQAELNSVSPFLPYRLFEAANGLFLPEKKRSPHGEATAITYIFLKIMSLKEAFSTKKDFDKINQQVTSLVTMDQDILKGISDIENQLKLMQVDILNFIANLAVNTYITHIETSYSTTSPSGLIYFSQAARDIQNGVRPKSDTIILRNQVQNYINSIYQYQNPNIVDYIAQIHGLMCPTVGETEQSVLNQYCDHILLNPATNFNNTEVHEPNNVMSSYLLLENYFLHLVNAQYKGVIIMGNVYNQVDTTGHTFQSYLNGTIRMFIKEETDMFMLMADKLAVNLVDYRSIGSYMDDIQYLKAGVRYDSICRNIIARSRMVSGLLLSAVNLEPIGFGFSLLIPQMYNVHFKPNPNSLALQHNGNLLTALVDQFNGEPGIPGMYPYIAWTSQYTCQPDNNWYFYSATLPASQVSDGSNNLQITQVPWAGTGIAKSTSLQGTYKALYYNPKRPDPSMATPVPTDSNTYKFGFVALNWKFGDLLTMRNTTGTEKFSNTWRNTPYMTYEQQETNPISIWMMNNGQYVWQPTGYYYAFEPVIHSDTALLYHHKFDHTREFFPLKNGIKFFMAQGLTSTLNITPEIPGSNLKPLFFYSTSALVYNTTGAGNTPCHTQFCMWFGGLGSFSEKQNIPNNLFTYLTTDFSMNYFSYQVIGMSPFNASQGNNDFSLAWEMAVDGAYKTPKAFSNFLPKVEFYIFGQMVYQGNWNIFN
jgi:hypothetical protein